MNIETYNARAVIIANAARKVQRNNVEREAIAPIECYSTTDFSDVIECVSFTNEASEEE